MENEKKAELLIPGIGAGPKRLKKRPKPNKFVKKDDLFEKKQKKGELPVASGFFTANMGHFFEKKGN